MIIKMDRATAMFLGKWSVIAMCFVIPIMIGYSFYQDSELGMIRKARELYNRKNNKIEDGYIRYYNKYPNGKYADESKNALIQYYPSVEDFFQTNVRSYNWDKVDSVFQKDIAFGIMQKTQSQEDSIDFDIYFIQGKDKAFLEEKNISNIGKRRKYKVIDRDYSHKKSVPFSYYKNRN